MSTNLPITFYIQHSFIHLIHLFNLIIHFHSSFHFLFIKNYNLPFIHSLIHSLVYSLDHLFVHSLDHLFVHSFVHLFIHFSFIHSITHSFNHTFIQYFTHLQQLFYYSNCCQSIFFDFQSIFFWLVGMDVLHWLFLSMYIQVWLFFFFISFFNCI